jgi:hypothetical protein
MSVENKREGNTRRANQPLSSRGRSSDQASCSWRFSFIVLQFRSAKQHRAATAFSVQNRGQ